jgi:hypothetical protein
VEKFNLILVFFFTLKEAILVTLASIRPRLEQTWAEISRNENTQNGSDADKSANNSSEHQSDDSDEDE